MKQILCLALAAWLAACASVDDTQPGYSLFLFNPSNGVLSVVKVDSFKRCRELVELHNRHSNGQTVAWCGDQSVPSGAYLAQEA